MFRLHKPEYTGENRCIPCTLVNTTIALFGAVLIVISYSGVSPRIHRILVAIVFLGISGVLIWKRGYLVPGTPRLTKQYFPEEVLKWFGKEGGAKIGGDGKGVQLESYLISEEILESCHSGKDLCLTQSFADELEVRFDSINRKLDVDRYIHAINRDPEKVTVEEGENDSRILREYGKTLMSWPSKSAMTADIGIAILLNDWLSEWEDLSATDRSRLIKGVRVFLEECPSTGAVELSSETVESCCSEHDVFVAVCSDTGDRLFEQTAR